MPEFRAMGIYRDLVRAIVGLFMRENSPETIDPLRSKMQPFSEYGSQKAFYQAEVIIPFT